MKKTGTSSTGRHLSKIGQGFGMGGQCFWESVLLILPRRKLLAHEILQCLVNIRTELRLTPEQVQHVIRIIFEVAVETDIQIPGVQEAANQLA